MTKQVMVFPGQGSQFVGMGAELYHRYAFVRELYDQADEILKEEFGWMVDLPRLCFKGPTQLLDETFYAQPALYVTCRSYYEVAQRIAGIEPAAVLGHSLGEYPALVAAGCLDFQNGVRLVAERANLMAQAGRKKPGVMVAIRGLNLEQVTEMIEPLKEVFVAAHNAPLQVVISGKKEAVDQACQLANQEGAKVVLLKVSVAGHSDLMREVGEQLLTFARGVKINLNSPSVPFYSPTFAAQVESPGQLYALLATQLTHPVQWVSTIERMVAEGYTSFLEVGPGWVLSGLIKKIVTSEIEVKAFLT